MNPQPTGTIAIPEQWVKGLTPYTGRVEAAMKLMQHPHYSYKRMTAFKLEVVALLGYLSSITKD